MTERIDVSGVAIECVQGDIARQPDVDAIVNAANAQLAPGGGTAGAIHRAGGPGLDAESRKLAPISTGQAVITSGHGLPNPWCIHALGPIYSMSSKPAEELASCYRESLARAEEKQLSSVAFPSISTGAFGYPLADGAEVALRTVIDAAPSLEHVRLVRFVLWGQDSYRVHIQALGRLTS